MKRKKIDKMHREYRTKRRITLDLCRYLLQGPAFERLNPEE